MKYLLIVFLFSQTIITTFRAYSTNEECVQLKYKECKKGKCVCEDKNTYNRTKKQWEPFITETNCENNSDCISLFDKKNICGEEDKCVSRQEYKINEDNTILCFSLF